MNLHQLISAKVAEELLTRVLTALSSVSSSVPQETLKLIVSSEVAKLGTFTFASSSVLSDVVELLYVDTLKVQKPDLSDEAAYALARAANDQVNTMMGELAISMAGSISHLVKRLRMDFPDQVDALAAQIKELVEAGTKEFDVRTITPANVYDWGRLAFPAFVARVRETCQDVAGVMRQDTYSPYELEALRGKLRSYLYSGLQTLTNANGVMAAICERIEDGTAGETAAILVNRTNAVELVAFIEDTFSDNLPSRLNVIPLEQKLGNISKSLDVIDTVLAEMSDGEHMTDVQIIADRLKMMDVMVQLAYGMIEIYRRTVLAKSLIVPAAYAGMPKGDHLYANADILPAYQNVLAEKDIDREEALKDVTVLYHYYALKDSRIPVAGIVIDKAIELRDRAHDEVAAAHAASENAANDARNRAIANAMTKVFTPLTEEKVKEAPELTDVYWTIHDKLLERLSYEMAKGDIVVEDAVTRYLVDMQRNGALTQLYYGLMAAMKYWSTTESDSTQIRDRSFCQAISGLLVNFIEVSDTASKAA